MARRRGLSHLDSMLLLRCRMLRHGGAGPVSCIGRAAQLAHARGQALYKFADVLIKNLSASATLALLVVLSALLFDKPLTVSSACGVVVIIVTSYLYLRRGVT